MKVYLSDFSQGNIRADVTEDKDNNFFVDIPDYQMFLIMKQEEEHWECTSCSGIYNPKWIEEIGYQLLHTV